jgi:fructose-1,6-bisphosphatase II / sedoheptulose-1,7-bisphosphatase
MTQAVERPSEVQTGATRPCICESYGRVTERAALAGARWLGRADEDAATEAASSGMQSALELLPIDGRIVIGAAEEQPALAAGAHLGAGGARTARCR